MSDRLKGLHRATANQSEPSPPIQFAPPRQRRRISWRLIGALLAACFIAWKFGSPYLPQRLREFSFAEVIGRAAGQVDAAATDASANSNAAAAGKKAEEEAKARIAAEKVIAAQNAAIELTKNCRGLWNTIYQAWSSCTANEANSAICDTRREISENELSERCPPIDPNSLVQTTEDNTNAQ